MPVSQHDLNQLKKQFLALEERIANMGSRLGAAESVGANHGARHNDLDEDPIIGAQLSGHNHAADAFPIVEGTNTSSSTATTSHTVDLPSGVQLDELLVIFFTTDTAMSAITWPTGWTEIVQYNGVSEPGIGAAWFLSDGSEGSSVVVTTASSEDAAHTSYRISNASPQTLAVATDDVSSAAPAPPSLTPVGGTGNYLWVAAGTMDDVDRSFTAGPASYDDYQVVTSDRAHLATAHRGVRAATEVPGTFTLDGSASAVTATFAVYPDQSSKFGITGLKDNAGVAIAPASDNRIQFTDDGIVNADKSGNTIALSITEAAMRQAVVAKTGAYVATATDTIITCDASGGAFSITLPTAVGVTGKEYYIKKTDSSANAVTIDGDGSETIDDATTRALSGQYDAVLVVSDNAEWWII